MRHRAPGSLDRRLTAWLALQSLLGWLGVCGTLFAVAQLAFGARQDNALALKQAQVLRLISEAGRVAGGAQELQHRLQDFLIGHPDMVLILHNADGTVLFDSGGKKSGPHVWREVTFEAKPSGGDAAGVTARLALDVRADQVLISTIGVTLLAAALLGSALVSLGAHFLVRRTMSPVRQLVRQTQLLSAETLNQRLDGSQQPAELQPLVAQFNQLLTRIECAYQQMENFNADVAHELATPLTTLIGTTELALRRPRAAAELGDALAGNLEELQRMGAIVRDMLFLAHADRGAIGRKTVVESIAALAEHMVSYHEATFIDAGLTVSVHGDARGVFDAALLERALSNLLANAVRYASAGSIVEIKIAGALGTSAHVEILVVNRGTTVPRSKLAHIFDRFYRDDESRTTADRHHGLGLAIVAAIARMHGGRPVAWSTNGQTGIGMRLHDGST